MRLFALIFEIITYVVLVYTLTLWVNKVAPTSHTVDLRVPLLRLPSLEQVHYCLKHVDEDHCGPVRDQLMDPFDYQEEEQEQPVLTQKHAQSFKSVVDRMEEFPKVVEKIAEKANSNESVQPAVQDAEEKTATPVGEDEVPEVIQKVVESEPVIEKVATPVEKPSEKVLDQISEEKVEVTDPVVIDEEPKVIEHIEEVAQAVVEEVAEVVVEEIIEAIQDTPDVIQSEEEQELKAQIDEPVEQEATPVEPIDDLELEMRKLEAQIEQMEQEIAAEAVEPPHVYVLSEEEQIKLIKKYAHKEMSITPKSDCAIGVGYTNCEDVGFRAKDLFKALEVEIAELGQITPQVHPSISTLQQFVENFLQHFKEGLNGEYVSQSKTLFETLLNKLEGQDISRVRDMGGHASIWTVRSQIEGCSVYSAPNPTEFILDKLVYPYAQDASHLQIPVEQLKTLMNKEQKDIHLVLEYNGGDEILGYTAPRSNRLYFVHDPNGGKFAQMEAYHSLLDSQQVQPYRHMFGGYQLLQKLTLAEAKERLSTMVELWDQMKSVKGPNGEQHKVHVEFGHFSNKEHFELFDQYAVQNADSLGMNEVEMELLLALWKGQLTDINAFEAMSPTIEQVLKDTTDLFSLASQKQIPLSRVHLHPYGSFVMCYKKDLWENAHDAIIKSSIVLPKYCIRQPDGSTPDNWENFANNFQVPERPRSFNANGSVVQVREDKLHYHFALTDEIECYLQFFLKCKQMAKTAGMGDTISGTGFIYHQPKI